MVAYKMQIVSQEFSFKKQKSSPMS